MEEVNELVKELELRLQEANNAISQYEKGKVETPVVLEHFQALNALSSRISIAVGDAIRPVYLKVRKAREQRNIRELGF